jgi:SAM-dependent methyltransferase
VAEDYDRLRPRPSSDAIAWLLPSGCAVAVDLAAGTGLLSRVLARSVKRVLAVEPDERMAAVMAARSPGVTVVRGIGEALPLADASVDAVLVSSAWHWLDQERAVPELGRVLRDGGRLGVLRTSVDQEIGWLRELRARNIADRERSERLRVMSERYRTVPETGMFGNAARESFGFDRLMDADDFVAMFATYSGMIMASEADRAARLSRVRVELDLRFPGATGIEIPMRTECWRADRVARLDPLDDPRAWPAIAHESQPGTSSRSG